MTQDQTRALLELLYSVSREVATALDLRVVLQRVLYAAIENVGGERGSIVVLDEAGKPLDATIVYGRTFHDHTTQQLKETVERGLAGWVIRERKAALVSNTGQDERWLRRPDDSRAKSGAKSAICVPLLAREQLVGVLTLVHPVPNSFGAEHLELMQAIADQAGIAVLNARLYTESQRQARVMTALAAGAVNINATLHLEDAFQRILAQVTQALQVESAALALVETASGELVFRAASGPNAEAILDRRIPAGEGAVGQVLREGRALVIASAGRDDHYHANVETRAVLLAPIQVQGQIIGLLEAINPFSGTFDPDAQLVMSGIGSLAGTTIQNALLFERLNQAHQQYRELFDDSIDSILITDWKGKVIEANRQAGSLSGYASEQITGLNIDAIHEVNWEKTGPEFNALGDDTTCSYESVLYKHNANNIPVEVYVRRLELEGTPALQWILRDITTRKMLDALRDDLTAMIYHDLRSPLSNIISSLDMLSQILGEEDQNSAQSLLTIVSNSTSRIQRLLNSLLDVNRLEAGQAIISQQAIDPISLVEEAISETRPTAVNRQLDIQYSLADNPPPVWADAEMLRRVLVNLLDNAIKFSPPGGKIHVGGQQDGRWIRLWVKDSGPGISAADQERVFDKYMRMESPDGKKAAGLGIGLAFCRLAIERHGGRIWVESQPNQGASFFFTVPISEGQGVTDKRA